MASVTISGEMLSLRTRIPLIRPRIKPSPRPVAIASVVSCVTTATLATMIPMRAIMLPMERST